MNMKLRERWHRWRFQQTVKSIVQTPVLRMSDNGLIVLSMVHHRDVLPYLLALKSFVRFVPASRVVLVADPTLDSDDRALLRAQVPAIEIRDAADFRRPGLPVGGCWERLSAISEYVAQGYVVQLDADTVSVAPLDDVRQAFRDGVSFTLGTEDRQSLQPAADVARWAQGRLQDGDHIQLAAEALLDRLPAQPEGWRYVRGCAGFAGFAPGSISPPRVQQLSAWMGQLLGERWTQWGTEQFMSNLLVANCAGARVLPHPRYCAPHRRTAESVFFHFIGYVRYTTAYYTESARQVIRQLVDRPAGS